MKYVLPILSIAILSLLISGCSKSKDKQLNEQQIATKVEEIRKNIPKFEGRIHTIDATGIALKLTGRPNPNVVLVGQLIKISEIVSLDSAAKIFRKVFVPKIGKELTKKNIEAMQVGFDEL